MLRLRSSTGQVAAEYMGVLLVVAGIVTALLGSQLHTQIAVEAQRAICKITGSSACGEPDPNTTFVSVPKTEVVEADNGFEWGDAAIGGGAALVLTAILGGTALVIRPHRASAH